MSEFKPIETQEQLDSVIKDRIGRAQESVRKEFEGWISPKDFETKTQELSGKVSSLTDALNKANEEYKTAKDELAERNSKIKAYETASVKTRIANELGLSYDAINFIQGEEEDSIRKSAESLRILVGANKSVPPLKDNEPKGDSRNEAIRNLARSISNN